MKSVKLGVVEKVDDLIETMFPIDSGTFHISGNITLQYAISGVKEEE